MRNSRKLLLSVIVAVAAFAFSASAASAQGVEVLLEDNGHCSDVVMDNHEPVSATCTVHATGSFAFYQHVAGVGEVLFSTCNTEFEAAFNESGAGFIYNQVLTPEGSVCGREVCDEAEAPSGDETAHKNLAWPAQLSEAPGVTPLRLAFTFCLYAHNADPASEGATGTPCSLNLWVNTDGEHNYEITSTNPVTGDHEAPCVNLGGIVEIEGHWVTGVTPAHPNRFEVVHLDQVG
jgi:hypothetical protein